MGRYHRDTTTRDRHREAIRRSGSGCHLCGQPIDYTLPYLDPMSFVVDHKTPLSKGGTDTLDNKAAAHRACNATKGSRVVSPIVKRSRSLDWPS